MPLSRTEQEQSFTKRFGDAAEQKFLEYAKARGFSVERYGFDRSNLDHFHMLPLMIRSTPDYIVMYERKAYFVECKAGSNEDYVKFMTSSFVPLAAWNTIMPVYIFFNDSSQHRVSLVSLDALAKIYAERGDQLDKGVWTNRKTPEEYVCIPKKILPWRRYRDF